MFRRIWSLGATLTLLVSFVASGNPAAAQDAGNTFTLSFGTCSWMSSTRDIVFASTMGSADSAFDCVAGPWPAELVTFTLDGALADSNDGTTATWTNVSNGLHSLDTHPQAPIQLHQDVTIDGDTDLWATFYFTQSDDRPDLSTVEPGSFGVVVANLMTCDVAGTADSVTLLSTATPPDTLQNCREGWAGNTSYLTLDGAAPNYVSANTVVWYSVPYGDHFVSAGGMDPRGDLIVTVDRNVVELWASWDKHVVPGGSVNVSVYACDSVTGPQSWIGPAGVTPDGLAGCVPANIDSREWGLRLDGSRPDFFQANQATWLPYNGTHVVSTSSGASYEVTVAGGNTELVAYFGPDGAASGGVDGTLPPGATVTPLPSLPNTGAGGEGSGGSPVVVMAAIAALVALMLAMIGEATRRGDRA